MLEGLLKTLASLLAVIPQPTSPPQPTPPPEPVTSPSVAPVVAEEPRTLRIQSSAYCHRGRTASGLPAGPGIAASNALYGRTVTVLDGPLAGDIYAVRDRHSRRYRELVDFWMDSCGGARLYGRRMVTVAVED